jgi:hypothetical protein
LAYLRFVHLPLAFLSMVAVAAIVPTGAVVLVVKSWTEGRREEWSQLIGFAADTAWCRWVLAGAVGCLGGAVVLGWGRRGDLLEGLDAVGGFLAATSIGSTSVLVLAKAMPWAAALAGELLPGDNYRILGVLVLYLAALGVVLVLVWPMVRTCSEWLGYLWNDLSDGQPIRKPRRGPGRRGRRGARSAPE